MLATQERLDDEIDGGFFTRGLQAVVSVEGETVLDVCMGDDGLGRAVAEDTLFRVYCSIKPITAMAVAHSVAAGAIGLDDPLADRLPTVEGVRDGVTLRHVLNHTAGLHRPSGVTMELTPPHARRALLDGQRRPTGWHVGADAGYSEYLGWHLLGRLLEEIGGEPLSEHLRHVILDPLELHDTFIGMTESEYRTNLGRIGVNLDMRGGGQAFPMLFERTERVCREANCAHGGYTTARDLNAFYRATLRGAAGEEVPGLPPPPLVSEFTSCDRAPTFDVILDRECEYGLGFMTGLAGHEFGTDCSARSYGHSGNVGSSFAFADPEYDLAVAVIFNGVVDAESAFFRRPALVRAIYKDLELHPPAVEQPEPVRRRFWKR